jgi:hypothetical protein
MLFYQLIYFKIKLFQSSNQLKNSIEDLNRKVKYYNQ